MSKEIVKAIFDENIAGAREDLTFDAYFDSIKGNEEYKKGLFENYVSDGKKSYEEFNAETFGMGKPEAPSEVGGAESSPTGLGLSESEVGPPAGGTPPGAEPVGAPVSDAIEPIEFGEDPNKEAPVMTRESLLDEFTIEDDMPKQTFWEKVVGFFTGDNVRPERVFVSQEHYDRLKARQDEELKRAEKEAAETGESLDIVDVIQDFVTVTPEEYVAFAGAIQRGLLEADVAERVKIGEIPTRADIIEITRIKKEQGQIPSSKNYEKFNDEKTSTLEALEIFAKDPLEIGGQIVLESGAALVRYGWDRALLAGGIGAAGGSVVPGIGTAAGGGMGLVAGMGVSGFSLGHASDILSSFQEAGVDLTDKYSLESAFSNKETIAKARDFALKRNVPILLFDLFSGGVAGRIVKAPAKSVIGKVAKETAELGVQLGLAGAGEAAGQITAGQKFDPKAILSEMIGEVTTGVPEIAIGRAIDTKPSAHVAVGQMVEDKKAGKSVKAQAIKIDAPADVVKVMVDVSVGTGEIDAVQADQIVQEYEQVQEVKKTIPEEFRNNEEVYSAIEEKKKLEEDKKTLDPVFTKGVDEKIAELNSKIEGIVSGEAKAAETQPAETQPTPPAIKVEMVERKRLSADRKRLVGTGKFDFTVTIDGKEQKISRAEYNEYKRSGKLPEGIGADVLGEVDRVEGVVVESTKDAESIKTSLEGVEVPAELGTIENVAEVYEQAKGKEELTDAEVAVVDFVEGSVAKVEGAVEGAVEIAPEAGSGGVGGDRSDADIEKRMAELEGAKIGTPELAEFNALEKEMEKRERDTVFNVPLENVNDAVDALMKKEKEQPNGFGSFIEKRDARETKEVADRYLNAKELTDAELKQDFSDAVRGNPTTWYADGLKMREALKEATNRGIDTKDMLAEVIKVYEDAGYDIETAKSVVAGMLKPIFEGSQKVNEKKAVNQPLKETPEAVTPEVPGVAEVAEGQPIAETSTQPLTLKEKAKEAKQKADEAAEEIKRLLGGRNGGLGISPFGRAKRLAEIDRAVVVALASYVRNKVLAGAYTFQDFVKDMKENSKRMFGVEIRVTAQDELFFNQSASMYEIDDAFAGEIMELKNDFVTAIAAMSGRINMNFEEFVASNQSLVDQFMDSAERNYGLNLAQSETLVRAMYQDALRAAANRNQLYKTEADIKNYQDNAILGNRAFQDVSNSNKAVEVARRSNSISRLYDGFLRAFLTPTLSFDRVFRLAKDRLSLEREVYASRKSRMGASTKAANWYSDVQKKIFGGLSWGQLERLNEYIIAKRILDVEEKRNQDVAYSIKLNEELADPATTEDRKAEINEELAKLGNLGEIKHGSAMLNGKKVELTVDFAQGVIDANNGLDAKSIEIRERAEAYRKANDELLKMRLDAGLISQAAYDSMIKRDYVRRIFLDLSSSTIDAVDYPSISAKIKAIQEGSTDKSLEMDTQALLQLNAAATFDAVAKNNFINKVAKWTNDNQQAFLDRALEKFEKKFEKKNGRQPTDDEIQKFLKEQTLFEPIRNNQTPRSGFEKITYFVDGVEKSIAVRADLAGVFQTASGRSPVQNKQLISVMSKLNLTGLIKASAVFFNPAFALGNFALDVVHASMVTRDLYKSFSANLGVILAKALGITAENVYSKAVNYGGSLFGMAKRESKFDRLVKDYFAHGGGMTFMSEIGSKMYTKRMAQSQLGKAKSVAVDNASKIISVFNSVQSGSELITRVIIYEAALEKNIKEYKKQNGVEPTGADLTFMKESAAASAADLIDFREGSNTTKGLDQTFMPFLNAMVQGARAEIDFIIKNPAVAALRLAEFGGMALAVALYNAKSGEDDEKEGIIGYNGVSEYIRANYFVMMMPWTKKNEKGELVRPYVSIKLPAMLKSINIFVEGTVSSRGSSEVTSQIAEALKGGYVPEIGAASPTTQAVFALTANRDFFRKGAKVYRGKEEVLSPERFNIGETKKIYRDLFGAAYDLMNEEGEDKGVLGFNEAGPAQWQTAVEKAISSNNPYYLGITSGYANISGLYGEKNQKEVDALYDDKLSALNSLTMRVYRTPQSSVQNSNSKKKEELKFLEKQIGSWKQRNTNTIKGVVSKELREISESDKKKGFLLDRFFDQKIFNYISDAELIKEAKKSGIKKLPENLDDIQEFIKDEQSRMSIQLVEEFKPNFIFRHPALKEYNLAKNSYVGFNEDLISSIEKEYDNAKDGESYLIALKFVAGDDYNEIANQIGVNPIEKMRVDNILKTPSAFQYKMAYFRRTNVSSNEVSSESAINNLILLKYLLENE